MQYPAYQTAIGYGGLQVAGHKACPHCHSINLDYPTSKIGALPFPIPQSGDQTQTLLGPTEAQFLLDANGNMDNDHWVTYTSWWCIDCQRSFEMWEFKPDDSSQTGENKGTLNAGF